MSRTTAIDFTGWLYIVLGRVLNPIFSIPFQWLCHDEFYERHTSCRIVLSCVLQSQHSYHYAWGIEATMLPSFRMQKQSSFCWGVKNNYKSSLPWNTQLATCTLVVQLQSLAYPGTSSSSCLPAQSWIRGTAEYFFKLGNSTIKPPEKDMHTYSKIGSHWWKGADETCSQSQFSREQHRRL